jgi:glyoxylase-like metal-dependent hydrolase (beta-lactamase superfamily II)
MHRITTLCLAGLLGTAVAALAQPAGPDYSKVEEKSTDLGKGIYEITGVGGNTTVAVGTKGILVVDTQFAPLYDKLRAAITAISGKPLLYVVNTHYHGDHTGGNAQFREKDHVTIVAHPNLVERLVHPLPGPNGAPGTPAAPDAVPNAPYSGDSSTLDVGGVAIQLVHPLGHAHTDGDTFVLFPGANVISTGDVVVTAAYPNIDVPGGGTIDGMIAGADFVIAHSDANTKIVPGHGALTNKEGVIQYRDMLKTARDRIAKAKASGMSEDQVAKANLLADLDKRWADPTNPLASRFPVNVYRTVK